MDVLEQLLKKGVKKFTKDVIVEGRRYTDITKAKNWAYNVKTFGNQAAEAVRTGKISITQLKKGIEVRGATKVWQSKTKEAIDAYGEVKDGATLYRIGKKGTQKTGSDAQYWSIEDPRINPEAYAEKYNMRLEDVQNADFIETSKVKSGGDFITREAGTMPGSNNKGQGIEVVVPKGGATGNKIVDL